MHAQSAPMGCLLLAQRPNASVDGAPTSADRLGAAPWWQFLVAFADAAQLRELG